MCMMSSRFTVQLMFRFCAISFQKVEVNISVSVLDLDFFLKKILNSVHQLLPAKRLSTDFII